MVSHVPLSFLFLFLIPFGFAWLLGAHNPEVERINGLYLSNFSYADANIFYGIPYLMSCIMRNTRGR